ncbi:putative cytochrome P450 E-class, group I [Cladorrhinum sp. PSN332]|nr:putative cytochrome P450 E-class, group I [Cladorrhinum sp. PSN332]
MTTVLQFTLTVGGLILAYLLVAQTAAFRRLQHIPGPAWAGRTSLWLIRRQLSGRVHRDLADLSKNYGPIFRIAPNWIVISDPFEVRRVWQARGPWYRGRWYDMFRFDQPVETVLSLRDNTAHNDLRSRLLPGYSGKDVDNLHSVVDKRIADFVSLIERKYLSTNDGFRPMDLAEKAQFMTLDIISDLAIGKCFKCLNNDHDTYGQIAFVTGSLPLVVAMSVVPASFMLLQNPIARAILPNDKLEGVGKMMALAQQNAAKRYGPNKIEARDMLGSFVNHGLPYTSAWLETFGQIGAGSDTTATAIRMTLFYLMTNRDSYRKLQEEIDAAATQGRVSSPVTDEEGKDLPYLQAVIKEGLRMWPPVAGLMPKMCDTEQTVCGLRIPPGTNVCWNPFAVLRNKDVFGVDAESFRPGRWLDEKDTDKLRAMEQIQGFCFGTTSRWECLGKAIAQLELNKVFVELLRRFDFSLVDPINPLSTYDVSLSIQSDMWVKVQKRIRTEA